MQIDCSTKEMQFLDMIFSQKPSHSLSQYSSNLPKWERIYILEVFHISICRVTSLLTHVASTFAPVQLHTVQTKNNKYLMVTLSTIFSVCIPFSRIRSGIDLFDDSQNKSTQNAWVTIPQKINRIAFSNTYPATTHFFLCKRYVVKISGVLFQKCLVSGC